MSPHLVSWIRRGCCHHSATLSDWDDRRFERSARGISLGGCAAAIGEAVIETLSYAYDLHQEAGFRHGTFAPSRRICDSEEKAEKRLTFFHGRSYCLLSFESGAEGCECLADCRCQTASLSSILFPRKKGRASEKNLSGSSAVFFMKTRRFPPPSREGFSLGAWFAHMLGSARSLSSKGVNVNSMQRFCFEEPSICSSPLLPSNSYIMILS